MEIKIVVYNPKPPKKGKGEVIIPDRHGTVEIHLTPEEMVELASNLLNLRYDEKSNLYYRKREVAGDYELVVYHFQHEV